MQLIFAIPLLLSTLVSTQAKPNFLILFADDLGYGDLSYNGHPTIVTPHVDAMAAEGIRFTQWYSGFHICSPSRAAMLTGRLPIRSGCAGGGPGGGVFGAGAVGGLPLNETTFAEVLSPVGYTSIAIGKWHLGQQPKYLPTRQGFDEYFGIPFSVDMGSSPWDPHSEDVLPLIHNETIIEQPVDLSTITARYASKAVDFMQRSVGQRKPFLVYLAFSHAHVPNFCSQEFCKSTKRGRFGDAVTELDNAVGTVRGWLKQSGQDSNTVVFFSSDNGPWLIQRLKGGSAGLFREGKFTTWEGGIRMPGIVAWPGHIPAGVISTEVVTTYDIFPTMASLAGATLPDVVIDGKDISDLLLRPAGSKSPHECVFHWHGASSKTVSGLWAVRCGAFKAHFYTNTHLNMSVTPQNPPLLYNVEIDPSESFPINSASSLYNETLTTIKKAADDHIASISQVPNQIAKGDDPSLYVCCDPNSKSKYPNYPNCTCSPANWQIQPCPQDDFKYSGFGQFDPFCKVSP